MVILISRARERLLDAADLLIDFLTLGEYGLEPAEPEVVPRASASAAAAADAPTRLAA